MKTGDSGNAHGCCVGCDDDPGFDNDDAVGFVPALVTTLTVTLTMTTLVALALTLLWSRRWR